MFDILRMLVKEKKTCFSSADIIGIKIVRFICCSRQFSVPCNLGLAVFMYKEALRLVFLLFIEAPV